MTGLVDLQRLVRVCGMLGSDHDGEVVAAARQAEKLRKALGLSWGDLLISPAQSTPHGRPPPHDIPDWHRACQLCLTRFDILSHWEVTFLTSLSRYRGMPSSKQMDVLRRLVERCRQAG
jgi:hypothetical protein